MLRLVMPFKARKVFDMIPDECRNSITWNGIVSVYVQNGRVEDTRRLFEANNENNEDNWDM